MTLCGLVQCRREIWVGTSRKRKNTGLPKYVYRNVKRVFVRHPDGHETWLAKADATAEEVWQAYLQIDTKPAPRTAAKPEGLLTLRLMLDKFMASPQFFERAERTRKDARASYDQVCETPLKGGLYKTFGLFPANDVTIVRMRLYMDARGKTSKKRANSEIAYLSIAYGWAVERGLVSVNPCKGIKKYKLQARQRYVTDDEYNRMYALARPEIQAVMELVYLCRLRENEALSLEEKHLSEEGLLAVRGKGSKTQLIKWSPRLKAAIDLARSVPRKKPTECLIVTRKTGTPLTMNALLVAWQKLRADYMVGAPEGMVMDWTLHDLKAKGVSDFEGDKHLASGHQTPQMTAVYDRKVGEVDSTR